MSRRKESLVKADSLIMRKYFQEALRLYGIDCNYYSIKEGTKSQNVNGEFSAEYNDPIPSQLIFDQVPTVTTLKKLGWVTEADKSAPLIHVNFDLPNIEVGCLFTIEDPLRPGKGRLFRITKLSVGIIYPMCVTAQVVAVLGDEPEKTLQPDRAVEINKENNKVIVRPEAYD